jgi:hypothetical protein
MKPLHQRSFTGEFLPGRIPAGQDIPAESVENLLVLGLGQTDSAPSKLLYQLSRPVRNRSDSGIIEVVVARSPRPRPFASPSFLLEAPGFGAENDFEKMRMKQDDNSQCNFQTVFVNQ